MKAFSFLASWAGLAGLSGWGAEVVVPLTVDPARSSLTLNLSVSFLANAQVQPLAGTMLVSTKWSPELQGAALRDFHWQAAANYEFTLGFGMTAGVTNLQIFHGQPAFPQPCEQVLGNAVTFLSVPFRLSGLAGYLAVDPGCSVLMNTSFGCEGTIDLAERMGRPWETFEGSLQVISNRLWFDGAFQFSVPIDAGDPGLGSIRGQGVVRASGPIQPCLWIELGESSHTLLWPSVFPGFVLERSLGGTPPWNWTEVEPFSPFDDGHSKSVVVQNEVAPALFYRLKEKVVAGP